MCHTRHACSSLWVLDIRIEDALAQKIQIACREKLEKQKTLFPPFLSFVCCCPTPGRDSIQEKKKKRGMEVLVDIIYT